MHRLAFCAGDGLAHERAVLIRGGDNFKFLGRIDDEPCPAASKSCEAGGFKLGFEIVEAAEFRLDGIGQLAAWRAARSRCHDLPKKRMI